MGDHINAYLSGNTWCSDCLPLWIDLNNPQSSRQLDPYLCTEYNENNTLLSLPYWCSARPNSGDTRCTCPKCENREFTGNTSFIESICDVGLTGVDNGLVQYMSGNTTEYDVCKLEFVKISAYTSTISGKTGANCVGTFSGIVSGDLPTDVFLELITGDIPLKYPCTGSTTSVTSGITINWNNFYDSAAGFPAQQPDMALSGCCFSLRDKMVV